MYFVKTFITLVAAAAMVSATPAVNARAGDGLQPQDNCGGLIGDCYSNGCNPVFSPASNTIGTCTAGTYNGCPCEKCGGGVGFVGSCSDNGCNGVQGTCTAGNYNGCPCN